MARNIQKMKEEGKKYIIESRYDITTDDLTAFYEIMESGTAQAQMDALLTAYYVGVCIGARKAKAENK